MALAHPVHSPSRLEAPRQSPRPRPPRRSSRVERRGLASAAAAHEKTPATVPRRTTRINGFPLAFLLSAVLWALILSAFFGG